MGLAQKIKELYKPVAKTMIAGAVGASMILGSTALPFKEYNISMHNTAYAGEYVSWEKEYLQEAHKNFNNGNYEEALGFARHVAIYGSGRRSEHALYIVMECDKILLKEIKEEEGKTKKYYSILDDLKDSAVAYASGLPDDMREYIIKKIFEKIVYKEDPKLRRTYRMLTKEENLAKESYHHHKYREAIKHAKTALNIIKNGYKGARLPILHKNEREELEKILEDSKVKYEDIVTRRVLMSGNKKKMLKYLRKKLKEKWDWKYYSKIYALEHGLDPNRPLDKENWLLAWIEAGSERFKVGALESAYSAYLLYKRNKEECPLSIRLKFLELLAEVEKGYIVDEIIDTKIIKENYIKIKRLDPDNPILKNEKLQKIIIKKMMLDVNHSTNLGWIMQHSRMLKMWNNKMLGIWKKRMSERMNNR